MFEMIMKDIINWRRLDSLKTKNRNVYFFNLLFVQIFKTYPIIRAGVQTQREVGTYVIVLYICKYTHAYKNIY